MTYRGSTVPDPSLSDERQRVMAGCSGSAQGTETRPPEWGHVPGPPSRPLLTCGLLAPALQSPMSRAQAASTMHDNTVFLWPSDQQPRVRQRRSPQMGPFCVHSPRHFPRDVLL